MLMDSSGLTQRTAAHGIVEKSATLRQVYVENCAALKPKYRVMPGICYLSRKIWRFPARDKLKTRPRVYMKAISSNHLLLYTALGRARKGEGQPVALSYADDPFVDVEVA